MPTSPRGRGLPHTDACDIHRARTGSSGVCLQWASGPDASADGSRSPHRASRWRLRLPGRTAAPPGLHPLHDALQVRHGGDRHQAVDPARRVRPPARHQPDRARLVPAQEPRVDRREDGPQAVRADVRVDRRADHRHRRRARDVQLRVGRLHDLRPADRPVGRTRGRGARLHQDAEAQRLSQPARADRGAGVPQRRRGAGAGRGADADDRDGLLGEPRAQDPLQVPRGRAPVAPRRAQGSGRDGRRARRDDGAAAHRGQDRGRAARGAQGRADQEHQRRTGRPAHPAAASRSAADPPRFGCLCTRISSGVVQRDPNLGASVR